MSFMDFGIFFNSSSLQSLLEDLREKGTGTVCFRMLRISSSVERGFSSSL